MASFKTPTFQERAALAQQAKQSALEKLKAREPVAEAVLAERRAHAAAREEAEALAREEKKAAREREKAEKIAQRLAEAAAVEAAKPKTVVMTEAEKKEARDARYAARKNRKSSR